MIREQEKVQPCFLKVSAFLIICVNTSGVDSWALIAKGEILPSVAAWMVLKGMYMRNASLADRFHSSEAVKME